MNKYQKAVFTIAAFNIILMLLFPPFVDSPLLRSVPRGFESFYFLPLAPSGRLIHQQLLSLEIGFVVANALAAWLVLNRDDRNFHLDDGAVLRGLAAFAAVNLAVIGLFPPFAPYSSLVRVPEWGFDGFYFVLGDKRHRQFFLPFLYLEATLVVINLLVAHLVFGLLNRSVSRADQALIDMVHHTPPQQVDALVQALQTAADHTDAHPHELGRREDRRHWQDPAYHGPERRSGHDRRHHDGAGD